jgi:hypothetical protein
MTGTGGSRRWLGPIGDRRGRRLRSQPAWRSHRVWRHPADYGAVLAKDRPRPAGLRWGSVAISNDRDCERRVETVVYVLRQAACRRTGAARTGPPPALSRCDATCSIGPSAGAQAETSPRTAKSGAALGAGVVFIASVMPFDLCGGRAVIQPPGLGREKPCRRRDGYHRAAEAHRSESA